MVGRLMFLPLLSSAIVLMVVGGRALAQGRPTTAANSALQDAIRALVMEAEGHLKSGAILREKADYFAPSQQEVHENELLEAMSRRISRNAFVDAYVKWQLTSGLPTKISDDNLRLAMRAYRSAPDLQRLPGTSPQEQQQLDQAILGAKDSDVPTFNDRWRSRVDPIMNLNSMSLNFRNAIAARLPLNADTIELMLMDAVQRTEAGHDVKKFVESLMLTIRGWAIDGAAPGQIHRAANMFARLREQKGATVYTNVQWDEKNKRVVWKKETRRTNPKYDSKLPESDAFLSLSVELQGYVRNPGGGLRLKDK